MILLAIYIIALTGITLWVSRKNAEGGLAFFLGIFAGMFIFFLGGMAWADTAPRHVVEVPLYSLNLSSSTNGSFFLGSGTVNGSQTYYYYTKDNQGFILGSTYETDPIHIVYTSKAPYADCNVGTTRSSLWFPAVDFKTGGTLDCSSVVFHIPEGSIKNNFNPNVTN